MFQPRRLTTTIEQVRVLIEFMEKHPEIARARSRHTEFRLQALRLWTQLAKKLNQLGYKRSVVAWKKHFNDYKCRVLNKARKCQRDSSIMLSPMETRLVKIVGLDRPTLRLTTDSDEPLQDSLDDSSIPFEVVQDSEEDTKPDIIQARSLSPPSETSWQAEPKFREDTKTDTEERATRAIESQAASMERMASALERLADAATAAIERYINNNNGQFI